MRGRTRRGAVLIGVVLVLVMTGCESVGRGVADDSEITWTAYPGTWGLPTSVIGNPTDPQPFQCSVNMPAEHDAGQCGPAHYQGQGIAVALPVACVEWLRHHWVPGATIDQASDASVEVQDPDTQAVLAAEPDLMDRAWGLMNPGGIYGAPMWPANVYFTYAGTGVLRGGGSAMGWSYTTPTIPALARYRVVISCVTAGDAASGYTRSVTSGVIEVS